MYKKTSKLIAGVMALAMAAVPTISAAPAEQSRTVMVIGESTFEKKSLPWHISSALPAKQSFELEDGTFHISIRCPEGADREKWDLQFGHRNLNFRAGHEYKVSFKAKSKREGFELCSQICDVRNDQNYFVLDGMTNDMHMGPDMGGQWPASAVKLSTKWQTFEGVFKPTEDIESAEWSFHYAKGAKYQGNAREGDEIWFDDMVIECLTCEESGDSMCGWHSTGDFGYVIPRSDVRLNQAGYYPDSKKVATYVTAEDREAMDFRVLDENGKEVLKGRTVPVGPDPEAGDGFFHKLDFSEVKKPGRYTIEVDDEKNVYTNPYSGETYKRYISHEFTVGDSIYGDIYRDAMNYFYLQRSDTDLEAEKIVSSPFDENRAKLAHKAYHAKDEAYFREYWHSSNEKNMKKDFSGGWYTDDNCGKNIIAGANTVWLLQNMYELSEKNGDKSLNDALDEARYELEFMLDMVVDPEKDSMWGEDYADMVYHGVRYYNSYDPVIHTLDMKHDYLVRLVNPPTYAATFDFIACAAQAARLWEGSDPDFAAKCLKQAKASWEAVKKHEDEWKNVSIHDEHFAPNKGSTAYDINDMDFGDINIKDEAYWAACELFATTGDKEYYDCLTSYNSELKLTQCEPDYYKIIHWPQPDDSFRAFGETDTLDFGTISLYLSDKISDDDRKLITVNIGKAADNLVDAATRNIENKKYANAMDIPYRQVECGFGIDPYSTYADSWKTYEYGSNSSIVNNAVILAYACDATGDKTYRDHAGYALDYIFGRNGLGISYVTGYGSYHTNNPSSNYWLNEVDKSFPSAPNGIMVGGPTGLAGSPDGIGDSFVKGVGLKIGETPDQQLYADSVQAWTCNSVTPQWQAAFAWVLSYFESNMGNDEEPVTTSSTTSATTTTTKVVTTITSTASTTSELKVKTAGDSNCDDKIDMSDIVLIMQALANPNKFGVTGSDKHHITKQGAINADVIGNNGMTNEDAVTIQKYLLKLIPSLSIEQ
ncbi:glycoside hydrolase family 9 protein [uncultured Ruminococcus sp.]|uniref:glycoside hydrolase family 9 protein n=1 Tax=uncultured Ruminococcus sp. TaxID=165186 RepID=UPI0025EE04E0|nr:glycoside hydrolase family 9 protein [uncultured Ruminococcus sp.]